MFNKRKMVVVYRKVSLMKYYAAMQTDYKDILGAATCL